MLRQSDPNLMTPEQALKELRKELAINGRIAELLALVAKNTADQDLRRLYSQLDHSSMLRLTGAAAGVEDFIRHVTAAPNTPAGSRK